MSRVAVDLARSLKQFLSHPSSRNAAYNAMQAVDVWDSHVTCPKVRSLPSAPVSKPALPARDNHLSRHTQRRRPHGDREPRDNRNEDNAQALPYAVVGTVHCKNDEAFIAPLLGGKPVPLDTTEARRFVGESVIATFNPDAPARTAEAQPVAHVREVLPSATSPRAYMFAIAAKQRMRFGFSAQACQEIATLRQTPRPRGTDFTAKPFVTIDNPTTTVMDQAVCLERDAEGYVLYYAIADASWLMPAGSAIRREAGEHVASMYLPCDPPTTTGEAISMLEPELGEVMGSLVPHQERSAIIVTIRLDDQGEVRGTPTFERGTIQSRAKLCYGGVQAYLDGHGEDYRSTEFGPSLDLIPVVGTLLGQREARRGVHEFNSERVTLGLKHNSEHEVEFRCEPDRQIDHWNAHISVLVNEAVGNRLAAAGLHAVYRVQAPQDEQRLEQLHQVLADLGLPMGAGETVSAYLARLDSQDPRAAIAQEQVLRHSQRAAYSTDPTIGHDALKLEHYVHFTAPMRRFVDIVAHDELNALQNGTPVPYQDTPTELAGIASRAESFRKRESTVERMVQSMLTAAVLQPLIGAPLQGVVVGLSAKHASVAELQITVPGQTIAGSDKPATVRVDKPIFSGWKPRLGDAVRVVVTESDAKAMRVRVRVEPATERVKRRRAA